MFETVQPVLGRKWHLRIVYHLLSDGPLGYSELGDRIDGISSKMLTESLATLEDRDLVDREIVNETPFRVAYSLTERGAALDDVVYAIVEWGQTHAERTSDSA